MSNVNRRNPIKFRFTAITFPCQLNREDLCLSIFIDLKFLVFFFHCRLVDRRRIQQITTENCLLQFTCTRKQSDCLAEEKKTNNKRFSIKNLKLTENESILVFVTPFFLLWFTPKLRPYETTKYHSFSRGFLVASKLLSSSFHTSQPLQRQHKQSTTIGYIKVFYPENSHMAEGVNHLWQTMQADERISA